MKAYPTHKSLLLAAASLLLGAAAAAADCGHTAQRTGEQDAAGVKRIVIVAEAGDLVVHGKAGGTRVVARGRACAESASQLERVQLETSRSGDTVTVRAQIERESRTSWSDGPFLDLDIEVPDNVELDIEDGSGDAVLRDLGKVVMEDGSGDLKATKLAGLRLVDGSGDIDIADCGELVVEDGSGDLVARRISANVLIEEDGSGDIDLQDVAGWVRVRDDGSGSIYVAGVKGDLTVDSDGSGSIDHKNVGGKVSIPTED